MSVAWIFHRVLIELDRQNLLVLVSGANLSALAEELGAAASSAPPFSQLSGWLASALISSPLVDEFYASDTDLSEIIRDLKP